MDFLSPRIITLMCEVDKSFVIGYNEKITLCEDANTMPLAPVFSWAKRITTINSTKYASYTSGFEVAYIWK
jgi:hypothetical protein